MGGGTNAYRPLFLSPHNWKPIWKLRHVWADNMKICLTLVWKWRLNSNGWIRGCMAGSCEQGNECEDSCLPGYDGMYFSGEVPTFRIDLLSPSFELKRHSMFYPGDWGSRVLRCVVTYLQTYTASHIGRQELIAMRISREHASVLSQDTESFLTSWETVISSMAMLWLGILKT